MTERYFPISDFDHAALGQTLGTEALPTRDVAHGDGQTLSVADGKAVLEVYPSASVARVTIPDARVEVYRVPGYSLNSDVGRVVFEQGDKNERTRLLILSDGKVSFHPVLQAAQSPTTAETPSDEAQLPLPQRAADETPTAGQTDTPRQAERSEAGEPEPVTLTGRLGRDPWYSTQEDTPTGGFPLAVNDDGKTTWHQVVVFDEAAEQLREDRQIKKGRLVEVTGQELVREEPTASGGIRKTRKIHATTITRLTASKPQPRSR